MFAAFHKIAVRFLIDAINWINKLALNMRHVISHIKKITVTSVILFNFVILETLHELHAEELQETSIDIISRTKSHEHAREQIYIGLESGINQLKRACISYSDQSTIQGQKLDNAFLLQINQLNKDISQQKKMLNIELSQTADKIRVAKDKSCNLFETFSGVTSQYSNCAKVQDAEKTFNAVQSAFYNTNTLEDLTIEQFTFLGKLERIQCVRPGFSSSLLQQHVQTLMTPPLNRSTYFMESLKTIRAMLDE